jgi:hypothetical protein
MLKFIICYFKGHDWECIPLECLKKEYNLSVIDGMFCIRCGKPDLHEKIIRFGLQIERQNKVKKLLSKYLWPPYKQTGIPCPDPWDAPPPTLTIDD